VSETRRDSNEAVAPAEHPRGDRSRLEVNTGGKRRRFRGLRSANLIPISAFGLSTGKARVYEPPGGPELVVSRIDKTRWMRSEMARDAESAYQAASSFNGEEDSCRSRRGQLAPGPEDPIDVVGSRAHVAAS
jgi:hypothetical protein